MKNVTFFTLLLFIGFTMNLSAQGNAVTSGASADLLVALQIAQNSPLSFGSSLLTDKRGGTVVLPSDNVTRIYSDGVVNSAATPAPTNASYTVTGTGLETYAVVLPTTTIVTHKSISSGVFTMNITQMKAHFNGSAEGVEAITSTLAENGRDSFTLGGTLTVQPDQIGGQYVGTFQVSVDYN